MEEGCRGSAEVRCTSQALHVELHGESSRVEVDDVAVRGAKSWSAESARMDQHCGSVSRNPPASDVHVPPIPIVGTQVWSERGLGAGRLVSEHLEEDRLADTWQLRPNIRTERPLPRGSARF